MDFLVAYDTDKGIRKTTNQDSFCIKVAESLKEKISFVILCDGMGGLSKGELASATVIRRFSLWFDINMERLLKEELSSEILRKEWEEIILEQNGIISNYGKRHGEKLGTTLVALLIKNNFYYAINIGDSRIYEIYDSVKQITKDHTLVAREIERGNITEEQAINDPRKSVLLQCVGASNTIDLDFFVNKIKKDSLFLICSDGFRNKISKKELFDVFNPKTLYSQEILKSKIRELIELNKVRKELDNITAIAIKVY